MGRARQCLVFLNMHPTNHPEVFVTYAREKFDENGELKDENTKKLVVKTLENLASWTLRLRKNE